MIDNKIISQRFLPTVYMLIPLGLVLGPLIPEIILFFGIIIIAFKRNELSNIFLTYKKSFFIFFIFYIFINLSSVYSETISESFLKSLSYIRFIFLVLFGYLLFKNKRNINFFCIFFLILFTVLFLDSNLQYWSGQNIIGYKYDLGRVTSFFNDEHILGSYSARIYPVILSLIFFSNLKNKKIYVYFLSFITFFMVFLSSERAAFFLLVISFVILSFLKNYRVNFIIFFVAIIIGISSGYINNDRLISHTMNQFYDKDQKKFYIFSERHQNHYIAAWNIFLDNKFLGSGIKSFRKLCKLDKYSRSIVNSHKISAKKLISPTNGQALIVHNYDTKNDHLIFFSEKIPSEILERIEKYKNNNIKSFLFTPEELENFANVKNFSYHTIIPGQLKLIPDKWKSEFLFIEIKKFKILQVENGDLLALIPKDQFIDGCNTHPHNTYIQLLAETGIVSFLIIFFIFIIVTINVIKNLIKSIKTQNNFYYGMLMLNTCFFINLFPLIPTGSFYNNYLSFVYFFPIGIYYALKKNDLSD